MSVLSKIEVLIFGHIVFFALIIPVPDIFAQNNLSLGIGEIDNSNFPEMEIAVTVSDQGFTIDDLNAEHFSIYENDGDENLLDSVEVRQDGHALAVFFVFDANPEPGMIGYREMQEFSQALATEILNSDGQDQIGIMLSVNQTKLVQTENLSAVKTTIRQMVVEDFRGERRMNDALATVLHTDTGNRRKVIVIFGPGNDQSSDLDEESIAEMSKDQQIPVYAFSFGQNPDEKYLQKLANETRGRFFNSPVTDTPSQLKREMMRRLKTRYILHYRSGMHQIDNGSYSVGVSVELGGQQDYAETKFSFPNKQNRRGIALEPLMYLWTLIFGLPAVVLAVLVLFRAGKLK